MKYYDEIFLLITAEYFSDSECFFKLKAIYHVIVSLQKVSEYDQEIPQSETADQTTAPRGRATQHLQ